MASASDYVFQFDASPYGLGGMLTLNLKPVAWFLDEVTEDDAKHLDIVLGSSSSQQACEALAVLVGLRLWISYWAEC